MMSSTSTLLLALFLGVVATVYGELADANDILGDLSLYDKLYVSYQNCAWSSYADGCDVEGEDDQIWWTGLTECYRANVAYSLYGVLKGEEDKGCTKATFINSFFTTSGIEYFTESMAAAGVSFSENDEGENQISSACDVVEVNDDENQANENNNNNYAVNNYKIYADDTSYGIGCVDNTFALKQYQGINCDERGEPVVVDSMQTFNNEISQAQCVVIYDASGNNAEDEEDENNEENGDALNLLQYSDACNIRNFPKTCPDPYGKIKKQARATEHAIAVQEHPRRERAKTVISWILLSLGIILLVAAAWAYYRKNRAARDAEASSQTPVKKGIFSGPSSKASTSSKQSTASSASKSKERKTGFWGKLRKGKGRN